MALIQLHFEPLPLHPPEPRGQLHVLPGVLLVRVVGGQARQHVVVPGQEQGRRKDEVGDLNERERERGKACKVASLSNIK